METARSAGRGAYVSLTVLGLAGLLLAYSVAEDTRPQLVAPVVLLVAVLAGWWRSIFRWESLIAAVVAVIFFIPIKRYTLPSALPFNLEPYRVMIAFVAFAWLTSLFIDRRVRLRRSKLEPPIALFVAAAIGSVAANAGRISNAGTTSLVVKSLTFFASFFVLFYVIVSLVRTRSGLDRLIRLLVLCGSGVGLAAVLESRTNYNVFNHLGSFLPFLTYNDPAALGGLSLANLDRSGRLRVFASSEHPIELSAVLVLLIPFALYLVKSTGRKAWFGAAVALGMGALATVSRTGIVMLVVIALVIALLRPVDAKRLAPLLVPCLCVVYFAMPHILGSFYSAFFPSGGIVAQQQVAGEGCQCGRLAQFGPSITEWSQRPLFGEGFGSRVVSKADAERLHVAKSRLLDDQWLDSLLETGIVGVFALGWLFVRTYRKMSAIARRDTGPDGWLAVAIASSVAAFAFGMWTFDALGFVQVTILIFIILALAGVLLNLHEPKTRALVGLPPDS
jgi:polysaccharide biosynthesis protein PslJ